MSKWVLAAGVAVIVVIVTGCVVAFRPVQVVDIGTVVDMPVGSAVRGEILYRTGRGDAPSCLGCHALEGGYFSVGPALKGVADRAASRVAGMTADAYLHQSIVDPKAYIVPGYRPLMYLNYRQHFSEQDIADLIAFLKTL